MKNDRPGGHFLNVSLQATQSNRSAIGARVNVTAGGRKQIDEVMGGGSYYSQNSSILHFGLGTLSSVEQVTVEWPSGIKQQVRGPGVDTTLRIIEAK